MDAGKGGDVESGMRGADPLLELYRGARTLGGQAFAQFSHGWMRQSLRFDSGSVVTSFASAPSYADANFFGIEDPPALMESFRAVSHLDELSPQILQEPLVVHRRDWDDPRIAGERFAPLREHLARFGLLYSLFVAIPTTERESTTVLIVARATPNDRFTEPDVAWLTRHAAHLAEAWAICRRINLLDGSLQVLDDKALALVDARGRIAHATSSFNRAFWSGVPPQTPHLPQACLDALAAGQGFAVPDSAQTVQGLPDGAGGWLVRLRAVSLLDRLTLRQRQIAARFAAGDSHGDIAVALGIAASTARNHLRHIYAKLEITNRVELIELMRADGAH